MASLSPSSSPALKPHRKWQKPLLPAIPATLLRYRPRHRHRSVADLSSSRVSPSIKHHVVAKDPIELWHRYVDWLYQHKELGLYLDVSRIGFTDEFLEEMEPRMHKAFEAMRELEKGAIANPDEGRMVGHYWLRNPKMAPNSFLMTQIEKTLDSICEFADLVISGKVWTFAWKDAFFF